jgi:anti-sigma B factor antagonist
MDITQIKEETYVSLAPSGELDANSSLEMDECIQDWLERGEHNFHIDGKELKYISSAGLGVFISHLDEIRARGGKLIFSNLSETVFDVFKLLGLTEIVTIVKKGAEIAPHFLI